MSAILLLAGGWHAFAQPDRSSVPRRLVKLSVAAIDANGAPVTDLGTSDFQVQEDGKPREIVFSRALKRGRRLAAPAAREFLNSAAATPTFILLDRWNERLPAMAASGSEVIHVLRHLESTEGIYVYFLTNHGQLSPVRPVPLTEGEARAADKKSPAALAATLNETLQKFQGLRDMSQQDPYQGANTTFAALNSLGQQISVIPGRKNLIWVTHGPAFITRPGRRVFEAFARSEIVSYAVNESASGIGIDPGGPRRAFFDFSTNITGGRLYPTDQVEQALKESKMDAAGGYTIAYYSPMDAADRKYHRIHLICSRKNVHLLTREGYYGDIVEPTVEDAEQGTLLSARRTPVDATQIALRILVSPNSAPKKIHLEVYVDPADLLIERSDKGYSAHLSVMTASYTEGFLDKTSAPVHMDFTNKTREQFQQPDGLMLPLDVAVNEANEKVRVFVYDRALRVLGSVTVPLS